MLVEPQSASEICDAIRAHRCVLAVGGRTKPRLSVVGDYVALISTRRLSGIVEYDPGEFTFTALAGTSLREIESALAERGQYLPFDPPLVESGATIGGTVAAGLSGPGRFRYGGVRDFILAVQFADGDGRLMRGGAKVVKNAAGFDIPKFLVGSCGRYGILTEVTFKVFPAPASRLTLNHSCASADDAADCIATAARSRWELEAIDYVEPERFVSARIAGPADADAALAAEMRQAWPGAEILPEEDADALWQNLREWTWAHQDGALVKVPITLSQLSLLAEAVTRFRDARIHFTGGGNLALISLSSLDDVDAFASTLRNLRLSGLALRGRTTQARLGFEHKLEISERVRAVFDPAKRFAPLA